ncbi:hypothetical protein TIFTF001_027292 [Ficus carica]|uniref:Rab-GAP TBC domain-containing protein n=1 Tax=Ficus carica TaxID=3494 RepID=A0AA88J024_FICCA|nr:hypothetical protein TIFTF001_027292 [Ficus carica]
MPRGKVRLPPRLGSLVAGSEDREEGLLGSDPALELGEELETFQPNGFGSDRESEDDVVEGSRESGFRVRQKPERNPVDSVSVMEAIAADEKRSDLEFELSRPEINLEKLQRVASTGLPYGGSLRAVTWKLLLGYLPPSRELWEKELAENRMKYAKLKEELLVSPVSCFSPNFTTKSTLVVSEVTRRIDRVSSPIDQPVEVDVDGPLQRHEISQEDHPLSVGKSSAWHQYFQHSEITEQIDRDLQRTHPDMKFFSGDSPSIKKKREAMRNILLLFAKLNPAIQYVQGMNEVLAPIFYVFSTDPNEQNAENAEADSFSCFVRLLSDSVDHFCQQLDNSTVGILATLSRLMELLRATDEELWRHLEFTTKVKPQYYAFRSLSPRTERNSELAYFFFPLTVSGTSFLAGYASKSLLRNAAMRKEQVAQDLSPNTSSYRMSPQLLDKMDKVGMSIGLNQNRKSQSIARINTVDDKVVFRLNTMDVNWVRLPNKVDGTAWKILGQAWLDKKLYWAELSTAQGGVGLARGPDTTRHDVKHEHSMGTSQA